MGSFLLCGTQLPHSLLELSVVLQRLVFQTKLSSSLLATLSAGGNKTVSGGGGGVNARSTVKG